MKNLLELKINLKWKALNAHLDPITNITFHKFALQSISPIFIATCSNDLLIKLWNAKTGEFIDSLKQGAKANPIPLAYRPLKNISEDKMDFTNGCLKSW